MIRDKYLSWVKIAKENNVTEMDKEFDIKFPTVSIAWRGSKWWFAFDRKITMSFLILDNGKMVAIWCPKVSASSNDLLMKLYILYLNVKKILIVCLIN